MLFRFNFFLNFLNGVRVSEILKWNCELNSSVLESVRKSCILLSKNLVSGCVSHIKWISTISCVSLLLFRILSPLNVEITVISMTHYVIIQYRIICLYYQPVFFILIYTTEWTWLSYLCTTIICAFCFSHFLVIIGLESRGYGLIHKV